MIIVFEEKFLKKNANNDRSMLKKYGKLRAEKIKQRLLQIQAAINLEEIRNLAGNWHELKGNRKGQWACDLDQPYRLIFEPLENPVPENENGIYLWSEIKGVRILEIINYHK